MSDLPVMLRVKGKRVVVVGGGAVALRRATSLVERGAHVTVIAPDVDDQIEKLGVAVDQRAYREGDLADAFMVVTAANDTAVNESAHREAERRGTLVNRADDPSGGDIVVMAHDRRGPITVGVGTDGFGPSAAAKVRDAMLAALDDDWITLLTVAAPMRARIKQQIGNSAQRREALIRVTDDEALRTLKNGGPSALKAYFDRVLSEAKRK